MDENTLRAEILKRIEADGLILADDPAALARLKSLVERVRTALPGDVTDGIDVLFVFRESDQTAEEMQGCDGWLWWVCGLGRTRHALGVSIEVLDGDQDYCILVILHELSHLRSGQGHNAAFSNCLDRLIKQYNERTGEQIENDYSSIMRPGTVGRMDGAKVPRIGQKCRGWPLGKL